MSKVGFGAILIIFCVLTLTLFCTFFSSRLAQLKNRSKMWGLMGLFFNVAGLVIVCFLPSRRKDSMQTNPILFFLARLPAPSRKTIGILVGVALAVIVTVILYDNIPAMIQNDKYAKQVTKNAEETLEQPLITDAVFVSVSTGSNSTYAITDGGDLYCWGEQILPQLDGEPHGVIQKRVRKAASAGNTLVFLTTDGEVYGCGDNRYQQLPSEEKTVSEPLLIAQDIVDFSVSETTVGLIGANGKLYMSGDNTFGQLGTGDHEKVAEPTAVLGNVVKVECEADYTLALQSTGEAVAFGNNAACQCATEMTELLTPYTVEKGIADIAAGDDFILLLNKAGKVLACGKNDCGQLGDGTRESRRRFDVAVTGGSHIYAAGKSAYSLDADGQLSAWGRNSTGQLGNGKPVDSPAPKTVAKNVKAVAASGLHAVILTNDDKLLGTGYHGKSQLGKAGACSNFETIVSIR